MSGRGTGFRNNVVGIALPQDRVTLTGTGPLPLDVGLGHEIAHYTPGREHGTLNVDRDLQESIVVRDENLMAMELGYAPALEGVMMSRIRNHRLNPWDRCFPAGTCINLAASGSERIETIAIGQRVLAFDGFGDLVSSRVARLYRNVTTEWLVLSNGLTVTPGHHVLNEHGAFEPIDALVVRGGSVVRADGSLEAVTAERIVYSDATRHLYEEAEDVVYAAQGGAALKPDIRRGWRTYNFEVEGLHTYVAGGVRVHNRSDDLDPHVHNRSTNRGVPARDPPLLDRRVLDAYAFLVDYHRLRALADGDLPALMPKPKATPLQQILGIEPEQPTPLRQVLGLD